MNGCQKYEEQTFIRLLNTIFGKMKQSSLKYERLGNANAIC